MAVVMNTVGAMAGTAVATTVAKGSLPVGADPTCDHRDHDLIIAGARLAAHFGIPVSKSHALLAGSLGAGLAGGGWEALQWSGWQKVTSACLLALSGFGGAFVLGRLIIALPPISADTGQAQLRSRADGLGRVHGLQSWAQRWPKFMGVFTLTLMAGGAIKEFHIPLWVIISLRFDDGLRDELRRLAHHSDGRGEDDAAHLLAGICGDDGRLLYDFRRIPLRGAAVDDTYDYQRGGWGRREQAGFRRPLGRTETNSTFAWVATFPACAVIAYVAAHMANYLWK